jgi:hypothetical protein
MEEKEFFRYEDVTVSNSRFIVASQTFAMSNITSVRASQTDPNRFWPIAFIVVGVGALLSQAYGFGAVLVIIGGIWVASQKTYYHVALTTAGGESQALTSEQKDYIEKVVQALNDAIVHRG